MKTVARYLLFAVAVVATFSIPALNLEQVLGGGHRLITVGGSAAFCVGAILLARRSGAYWLDASGRVATRLAAIPRTRWILGCIAVGVALRAAWIAAFPFEQQSDSMTYGYLAHRLATGAGYEVAGMKSNWPPGFPLLLSVLYRVLGEGRWVHSGLNLALFAAAVPLVDGLARRVAREEGARIATGILTVWPNAVMTSGVASKELLVLTLLPMAIALFCRADARLSLGRQVPALAGCGIVLGATCLVQPGLLALPAALLVGEVRERRPVAQAVVRITVVAVCMLLPIFPWTLRNQGALGEWVLISTNGGDVFYRANNPLATGGYTPRGERDLDGLGELDRSRKGMEWGKEWIRSNPTAFAGLCARKQMLFLGDDSTGAFETLQRGGAASRHAFVAAKGIANAFWLAMWLVILAACFETRLFGGDGDAPLWICTAAFILLLATHTVFESNGKYHVPALAILSVIVGGAAAIRARPSTSSPS